MKKLMVGVCAVIGLLALLVVIGAAGIALIAALGKDRVPSSVILEANFERGMLEALPDDPLGQLMMEDVPRLQDIVAALDRAADDRRVEAFVARIGGAGLGLAHIQEIRDAVIRFRASGKPAYAYAETFGEFGPGNGGYYLASAFDEIFLQPSGDVGLTGLIYESPFIRGLLDKLDVEPEMSQRYEYKNAMNYYTDRKYNVPYRAAMQELMDSQFAQITRGIAEARGLTVEDVRALFDRAPFIGEEALEAGLVDGMVYRDEVYDKVREVAGEDAEELGLSRYLRRAGRPHRRGETIALIHGFGTVVRGRSGYSPLDGSVIMGADTVAGAFRSAIEDDDVKAIVFRVDCPGGSYVASDTIRRETIRAREADKPVIVSMGNVAGSGGYFVALEADKIVAQPGTITASIGVLGGKLVTREAWAKVGVSWDEVHTSKHSTMWSATYPFGDSNERFQASLDRIYDDFTRKVAAGRDLPLERVLEIAKGRIWTGEDALELGLVDELGGVEVALRLAREAAGLDEDTAVRLKRFPARRSPWELLLGQGNRAELAAMAALSGTLEAVQPRVRMMRRLGLVGGQALLTVPDVGPVY